MVSTEHVLDEDSQLPSLPVSVRIQNFVDELATETGVCGIGLFGSQARGTASEDSDADLLVLVEQPGFSLECTARGGQDFEVVRLGEATAMEYFTDNRDAAADAWPTAKILYDPEGRLGMVRERALALVAEGKPPVDPARLEYLRRSAMDQIRAAARLAASDVAGARVVLYDKVIDLTSLYYDVRQMWTPHLKRRMASIGELDREFHGLLQRFFATDTPLDEQLRLGQMAVDTVFGPSLA
ncbi:MAG: nucleotidyltransferase family protein [Actinomycetes bacterium]